MLERRKTVRGRTFLGGVIAFCGKSSTLDCLVRNLSPEGAKVELSHAASVPEEFDLAIAKRDGTFRARLIWRRAEEAGVLFVGRAAQPVASEGYLARWPRRSENERPRLRERLRQPTSP